MDLFSEEVGHTAQKRILMTKDELEAMLGGEDLIRTLDVKTLVLDILKEMPESELLTLFWDKLPGLSAEYVRDYLYMRRS
jgi:hypothetical protein